MGFFPVGAESYPDYPTQWQGEVLTKLQNLDKQGFGPRVVNAAHSNFANEVTLAGGAETVIIVAHAYAIPDHLTVPLNVHILPLVGGLLAPASGKTLTIQSPFACPRQQIFGGLGSVAFGSSVVEELFPEWFAGANDAAKVQAAINASIDPTTRKCFAPVVIADRQYTLGSTLTIESCYGFKMRGSGPRSVLKWDGNSTSPMLMLKNVQYPDIGNFDMTWVTAKPLRYCIQVVSDLAALISGAALSKGAKIHDMWMLGDNGACFWPIVFGGLGDDGDANYDVNNDFHELERLFIAGYEYIGVSIENSQVAKLKFRQIICFPNPAATTSVGISTAYRRVGDGSPGFVGFGGSFDMEGGQCAGTELADFYLGSLAEACHIQYTSEGSKVILLSSGPNGGNLNVHFRGCRFNPGTAMVDGARIFDAEMPGPISVEGCQIGDDYTKTFTFKYTPGGQAGGLDDGHSFVMRNNKLTGAAAMDDITDVFEQGGSDKMPNEWAVNEIIFGGGATDRKIIKPHLRIDGRAEIIGGIIGRYAQHGDVAAVTPNSYFHTHEVGPLSQNCHIHAPTNLVAFASLKTQRISFYMLADGGGARTITWNVAFVVLDFPASLSAGKAATITFEYNSVQWIQVGKVVQP